MVEPLVDVSVKDIVMVAGGGGISVAMWLFRRQDAALREADKDVKNDLYRRVDTLETRMADANKAIGDLAISQSSVLTSLKSIESGIGDLKEHMGKQDSLMVETLRRVDGKVSRNTLNMILQQFPNLKLIDLSAEDKDV
jgi:hypothetical protein